VTAPTPADPMSASASTAGQREAARPASALRSVAALTAMELKLAGRRGENVLVMLVIPVAVLLFFGGTSLFEFRGEPADTLVPGTIALAIIAAGLVNLGIATAYERHYGVLKRLGGAPIPRWAFVAAKTGAVLVIEAGQIALLVLVGMVAFGWAPGSGWSPIELTVAVLLGTVTFVSLGLVLAGTLRAEAVLALANGLFLGFLMLGGIVVPVGSLPDMLQPVAALLPSTALAEILRFALDSRPSTFGFEPGPVAVLSAWAIVSTALAVRFFRWD
jgi:ABC-2 type transport system permease protein